MRTGCGCFLMSLALVMLVGVLMTVGAIAVPNFLEAQTGSQGVTQVEPDVYNVTSGAYVIGDHSASSSHFRRSSWMGFTRLGLLGLVLVLPLLCLILLRGMVRGAGSERKREANGLEDRGIQDLHHGFSELEKRIESLETILIEKTRRP